MRSCTFDILDKTSYLKHEGELVHSVLVQATFGVDVGGIYDVSEIIPASSCRSNYFQMTHVDI